MNKIEQRRAKSKRKIVEVMKQQEYRCKEMESRVELIRQLIPIGLMKIQEELEQEVEQLAGERYSRGNRYDRYGYNPGSVVLGGQRIGIEVPRVRNSQAGVESPLKTYSRLHEGTSMEESALVRVLKGMATRDYREATMAALEAFGLSSSNVSRQFIRASTKKLKQLMERDLPLIN
jgi:hypothetical protein